MKRGIAALALVALALAGCSSSVSDPAPTDFAGTITVYAAASLTATFTELGTEFEKSHPGTRVKFVFGGSADLVSQLTEGAPGDVFAAADTKTMTKITDAQLAEGAPTEFATNTLQIATPPGNPAQIESFADLARPGLRVVVCAPQVPCGALAARVQELTGVTLTPASEQQSVTDVLGTVESGEADAGLVYVTDVTGAGTRVTGVAIPEAADVATVYSIVGLSGSAHADIAEAFVSFVASDSGRAVLSKAGFGSAP